MDRRVEKQPESDINGLVKMKAVGSAIWHIEEGCNE